MITKQSYIVHVHVDIRHSILQYTVGQEISLYLQLKLNREDMYAKKNNEHYIRKQPVPVQSGTRLARVL